VSRSATLSWNDKKALRFGGPDNSGGQWTYSDLTPGKFKLAMQYEYYTEQQRKGVWIGKVTTEPVEIEIRDNARAARVLSVPPREHGYDQFKSQVISSQKELDAFTDLVKGQKFWNNKDGFLKGLADAKVDFSKECLVLLRHEEGSGGTRIAFAVPELKDDRLLCTIRQEGPQGETADMAYYCYALAVEKDKVKRIEVWLNKIGEGKPRGELTISKE
jgi:hypothetical protein